MGGAVVRAAAQSAGVELAAAIDRPGSAQLGKDAGEISGVGSLVSRSAIRSTPHSKPNTVIIDFTNPEASLGYLRAAAKHAFPSSLPPPASMRNS